MQQRKQLNFILVKPSGPDCNLACSYCFYTRNASLFNAGNTHRMSDETLEAMIRKSLGRNGETMSFGWQGGEPTLMGLDFFHRVVDLQRRYGPRTQISNSLQTNGLLIDDEWIAFLRDHGFLVGLSLDGPAHVHDQHRLSRNGRGSHAAVEKSAKALLAGGVAVNALSVVTSYSAGHVTEIYRYLKSLGFNFLQFIPCLEMAADGSGNPADYSVSLEQYGQALCELFDLWTADFVDAKPTTSIRLFETFASVYLSRVPAECTARRTCGEYLVVEHDGGMYSCDFFVEDAWHLGNVVRDDPLAALNSPKQTLFGNMKIARHDKCQRCSWRRFCHGGCTKDRLRDPRDKRFNHFCESYKIFFAYADRRFRVLMESYLARYAA